MDIRYYIDPETGLPHVYRHGIREIEVEEVLHGPAEDLPAKNNARMKLGQTGADDTFRSSMFRTTHQKASS